ncbi:aspartate/glutamate racemase family protein [Vreelandella olivaria]|uniref:aspartate/glutamate racemase family protein n=1 Tax=Vreelandella olivaria TaxID=390919 RepID=UPI00201E7AF0|nr:hypothetical protein [Halomonas olivaria]
MHHDSVIYRELCLGVVKAGAKAEYLEIITSSAERGHRGGILGCTEIGLLIQQADTDVPLFDTTEIHAEQAVQRALGRVWFSLHSLSVGAL